LFASSIHELARSLGREKQYTCIGLFASNRCSGRAVLAAVTFSENYVSVVRRLLPRACWFRRWPDAISTDLGKSIRNVASPLPRLPLALPWLWHTLARSSALWPATSRTGRYTE